MKKHLIYYIVLMALIASCVEEPTIYRLLPNEDAAAIPYQTGQMLNFIDQNGDTLFYSVTYDETNPFSEDYWDYPNDAKMQIIQQPWCYARTVLLRCDSDSTYEKVMFTVIPEKYLYFRWNHEMSLPHLDLNGATETVEVNGVNYENVHVSQYYDTENGEIYHLWYYNEEVGLIAVKNKDHSLVRIP